MHVVSLKRWRRDLNADDELISAVMAQPDLLLLILASVGSWTDAHPLHTMGVTRRVCKQWDALGRTKLVRRAYCAIQDYRELPRWCCPHLPMPGCVCQGCDHIDLKATWFHFSTYCADHNVVMLLPPLPPKKTQDDGTSMMWTMWDPTVVNFAELFPNALTTIELWSKHLDGSTDTHTTTLDVRVNRARKRALNPSVREVAARQRIRFKLCACSARSMADNTPGRRTAQAVKCMANKVCRWTPWSEYCETAEITKVKAQRTA